MVWGEYTDSGPDWDIDADASQVEESLQAWKHERARADELIAGHTSLDDTCEGNRRSVRWNLTKLIGEYSRHNGQADLIRECIDGQTGESCPFELNRGVDCE